MVRPATVGQQPTTSQSSPGVRPGPNPHISRTASSAASRFEQMPAPPPRPERSGPGPIPDDLLEPALNRARFIRRPERWFGRRDRRPVSRHSPAPPSDDRVSQTVRLHAETVAALDSRSVAGTTVGRSPTRSAIRRRCSIVAQEVDRGRNEAMPSGTCRARHLAGGDLAFTISRRRGRCAPVRRARSVSPHGVHEEKFV
jgi:hypothetical protein